ncbi:MAG: deoxyribodipyrimidine photo-lyase [Methyloligellaceae bacterium]
MTISQRPIIFWLRNDLRLHDQPALAAAAATGAPVIPLYILDDDTPGKWKPGGASRWWLHHSLKRLDESLRKLGSRLVLARGPAPRVLADLAAEAGAGALFWSRGYEPWAVKMEQAIHRNLERAGVRCRRFSGHLLFEPEDIRTGSGDPYRVFTPFYKACLKAAEPALPAPPPTRLPPVPDSIESDRLDSWGLVPSKPDWSGGIAAAWTPGEAGAQAQLKRFLEEGLAGYAKRRDTPGAEGTSRLSPHLHFGEISPRQVWHAVNAAAAERDGKADAGAQSFLRELIWREFSHHLLFHWPHLPDTPLRHAFARFPWAGGREAFEAWKEGRTGYPIVDAGMRELWTTGWMHNRVRMIVASFLVKHLLIPWQEGAAWFWDTLVDADLANNSASWQWVAGCGSDAAPYFRIFNPVLQGQKFDPQGIYVKAWVPELAKLPKTRIHAPWEARAADLKKAKIVLGETYPRPVIDHREARARALAAYERVKQMG